MDILTDSNFNIVVSPTGKNTLTPRGAQQAAQRLAFRLHIFLGELKYASNIGIPYLQEILGLIPSDQVLDQIFRQYIEEDPETPDVTEILITRDLPNRKATLKISVRYVDGTLITVVTPNILSVQQVTLGGFGILLDGVPVIFDAGIEPSDVLTVDGVIQTLNGEPITF